MITRIVLAEDHQMVREGIAAILAGEPRFEVVGQAATGREVLKLVCQLVPHVVVMDVNMPDLNGVEATRRIVADQPEIKVVALSGHSDKRYVLAMLEAGASAYVLKISASGELLRAIHSVREGKTFLSDEVAGAVVEGYLRRGADGDSLSAQILGGREREVLQLLAEGKTSAEIGRALHVSAATVETHRRNIMRKLNLHTVAELTKFAVREGLTSP